MTAAVESNIYPYAEKTENLPVCLRGIGGTEWQGYYQENGEGCWFKILWCISGMGCINYDEQSAEISEGDLIFMPKAYHHEYYPYQPKWTVRWIVFDGYDIERTLGELGLDKPVLLKSCDTTELNKLFNKIMLTLRTDRINGIFRCSGLCYDIILELHSLILNAVKSVSNVKNDILLPVINHIEDNFNRDLPISELVGLSGVSHQYLGRIFRQAMGSSIEKYIKKRRILEAKHLLLETDEPVNEISDKCGFREPGYFSTVFKRSEGISPIEYRRMSKKQLLNNRSGRK